MLTAQFLESTWMSWASYSGYYLIAHHSMREAIQTRFMPTGALRPALLVQKYKY
jgi:hypothetical protein